MVKIVGLQRLNRRLDALAPAAKSAARQVLEKYAEEIVELMRRLVPKDTRQLHDSIGWTWGRAPRGSVRLGRVGTFRNDLRITIFAGSEAAYYARFVEFGTSRNRAQPYFFPAYRAKRPGLKSELASATNQKFKKVSA